MSRLSKLATMFVFGAATSILGLLAYQIKNQYELLKPETLKAIRLENEKLFKLLEIMEGLNKEGLKKAVAQHVPEAEFDNFVNTTVFAQLSKVTTRLCEYKIAGIFFNVTTQFFSKNYDDTVGVPTYYTSTNNALISLSEKEMLQVLDMNKKTYGILFTGDNPVITKNLFSYNIDYDKLAALVRDPEKKLFNELSCDDYTLIERLYLMKAIPNQFKESTKSEFKKDLVEFHKYHYDKEHNAHLVKEIYQDTLQYTDI